MATRTLTPEQLASHLKQARELAPLYVLAGDEPLLVIEAGDGIRAAARAAGYTERTSLVMDARSDWSALTAGTSSASLFGERRLLEVRLPTGKPGKTGSDALIRLAEEIGQVPQGDTLAVVQLPRIDRAMRATPWFTALTRHGVLVDIPTIDRSRLPAWIGTRLAAQGQSTDNATLQWIADRVEGNLLAAHQEIMKLSLIYPPGPLTAAQVQEAVMNVARYNAFNLRDAILAGDARRVVRMLDGLQAEGEAPLLVLWAITQAWGRHAEQASPAAVRHAHDIDRMIKGLKAPGRLDVWTELTGLALSLTRRTVSPRAYP